MKRINYCECGCGKEAKIGNRFLHGHHARGRKKSEEEKRKIGEKNSINMKRYMKENQDVAFLRGKQLRLTWTNEMEENRVASTRKAYASMSVEDKQKFSDHAKELWNSQKDKMMIAAQEAGQTFKQRAKEGKYDFESRNDKISESITKRYLEGGFEWSKGKYVSTKTGIVCFYRSSWEKLMMERLDHDPDVTTWEYEFDSLAYEFDGKSKRYIPDFHITTAESKHVMIEVKPESLRNSKMNEAKRQSALEYCLQKGWVYQEWEPSQALYFKPPT